MHSIDCTTKEMAVHHVVYFFLLIHLAIREQKEDSLDTINMTMHSTASYSKIAIKIITLGRRWWLVRGVRHLQCIFWILKDVRSSFFYK